MNVRSRCQLVRIPLWRKVIVVVVECGRVKHQDMLMLVTNFNAMLKLVLTRCRLGDGRERARQGFFTQKGGITWNIIGDYVDGGFQGNGSVKDRFI